MENDVTNPASTAKCVEKIIEKFGYISILINTAGVLPPATLFIKTPTDMAQKVMEVNFWGIWHWCQKVLPHMRNEGYGRIINISSIAASKGDAGNGIYAASKAAVTSLTKTLSLEVPFNKNGLPFNITVNAVAPGIIKTNMTADLPEKTLGGYIARVPFKRLGEPEEIAEVVTLMAEFPQYFNGQIITVDGGYSNT